MGTHPIFESDFDCLTEGLFCSINVDIEFWTRKQKRNQRKNYDG